MRLDGRVAIVTGAGQGIGKAYAARYLDEGARVVIADYNAQRGETALAELSGRGDVIFVPTDMSVPDSCEECARRTLEAFGPIDILDIDNEDNSYDYFQQVFAVNLHGAWLMARAVTPTMTERRWGRIINQSSGAAYLYTLAPPQETFEELGAFTYSQTKRGIVGLTKFLAGQLGQFNVTVNCIAPGVTLTDATRKVVPPEFLGIATTMNVMRQALEPEDFAGAAVFFASDDAALITGQVLCVDGGLCMPG